MWFKTRVGLTATSVRIESLCWIRSLCGFAHAESAAWKYNYAQQISILNSIIRKFKDQNLNLIGVILKRADTEANINLIELQSIDHKNRQKMNFADRWQFRMWIFFHTIFGPNQEDLRKIKLYWPSGRNVLEIFLLSRAIREFN